MNENDIKKCIKNGIAWEIVKYPSGEKLALRRRGSNLRRSEWNLILNGVNTFPTKVAAKLAIATRREDDRVAKRKAAGTQVLPSLNGVPAGWRSMPLDTVMERGDLATSSNPDMSLALTGLSSANEAKGGWVEIRLMSGYRADRNGFSALLRRITETPEPRDARLKALYESYCKQGGLINKEQLTDEMMEYLDRNNAGYFGSRYQSPLTGLPEDDLVASPLFNFHSEIYWPSDKMIEEHLVFWTRADAAHDHFLRTWKGPLTEEAKKKLRKVDTLYYASDEGVVRGPIVLYSDNTIITGKGQYFLVEAEAKTAAHDLWLADRRKNQIGPITPEQAKMLRDGDDIFCSDVLRRIRVNLSEAMGKGGVITDGVAYFTREAAQAALDKAKAIASHETPKGETQQKEVVTDETQDKEPEKYMMDGSEFCGITPEWKTWKARQDAKAKIETQPKPKEWTDIPQVVTKRNTDDSVTHPKHYTSHPSGIECIQVTEHMNFCRGNAVKYVWRAGEKGDEIEDLKKARWYLDREIARLEKAKEQK